MKTGNFFAGLEKLLKKLVVLIDLMVFNTVFSQLFIIINIRDIHKKHFKFFYSAMETKREIVISTGLQIQKPPRLSVNGTDFVIYSPMTFKLRPC